MNLTKPNLKDDEKERRKRIFNDKDFQVLPYLMKQRFLCKLDDGETND
jgi:hypothetical protein